MQVQVVFTLKSVPRVFTETVEVASADLQVVKAAISQLLIDLGIQHKLKQITSIVQIA